jgi:hypothetical protein
VAAISYVILGVLFQTVFLNWVIGPLYVVVVVSGLTPWLARPRGAGD